jgi:OOP family OmpA-OmpF porin
VLKIKNVSWSAAFVLLLAACSPQEFPPTGSSFVDNFRVLAGDWDVEAVKSLPRPEGEFEAALFDEYIRLGAAERAEADWQDTTFFLNRARRLSKRRTPDPTPIDLRDMPADSVDELTDARRRLMIALSSTRRWKQPIESARAQASFDCWMQEREEDFQTDDINSCRSVFLAEIEKLEATTPRTLVVLLPDLDGEVGEVVFTNSAGTRTLTNERAATTANRSTDAPAEAFELEQTSVDQRFGAAIKAQPVPPERFIIFFELRSSDLTDTSAAQIPQIIDSIARHPAAEVDIVGHADRSGSDAYNDALSLRRANEIRQRIIGEVSNPAAVTITAKGEKNPVVDTPDGVVEPQNRRVEVTVR